MITIEHKEEYINGEKVEDYYNITERGVDRRFSQNFSNLSLQDLQELYDKLGEIINKKP